MIVKLNAGNHQECLSVVHPGVGKFNFGILIAADLNFLCAAHLLDMCSLSAAEK